MCTGQTLKELNFNSNVPDAENNYVAVPREKVEDGFGFGYIYFDDVAGYTYRILGSLKQENGNLVFLANQNSSNSISIQRIENLEFKAAKIPAVMVEKFGFKPNPDWMKSYTNSNPNHINELNRASHMNGKRFPQLALPKLLSIYNQNFKSEKFYFELAFAYNALKDYEKSVNIVEEALKNNYNNELLIKEKHFSLVHQNKLDKAGTFLKQNFKNFKTNIYKSEGILNMAVGYYNQQKYNDALSWLSLYKTEVGNDRYKETVEKFENQIKNKMNK